MTKKITQIGLGILLLLVVTTASAQNEVLQKGKIVTGGALTWSYSATKSDVDGQPSRYSNNPSFNINIAPMAMYMVMDKLAVGADRIWL